MSVKPECRTVTISISVRNAQATARLMDGPGGGGRDVFIDGETRFHWREDLPQTILTAYQIDLECDRIRLLICADRENIRVVPPASTQPAEWTLRDLSDAIPEADKADVKAWYIDRAPLSVGFEPLFPLSSGRTAKPRYLTVFPPIQLPEPSGKKKKFWEYILKTKRKRLRGVAK